MKRSLALATLMLLCAFSTAFALNPRCQSDDDWTAETDAFTPSLGVALLDLTTRNGETEDSSDGRNLYSATYMLQVAGVPYFTTADLDSAMTYGKMILFSSPVKSSTFKTSELNSLRSWVSSGGVIVSPACTASSTALESLYGATDYSYLKTRFAINWLFEALTMKELEYMDEEEELTISLGKESSGEATKSYGYTLTTAEALATFDTGEAAVTMNSIGSGRVYLFGVLWRDMIQRPQLNKDFEAQRCYSNGFEVSADAFPLFVRSAYARCSDISVWKHTIPDGYETVLIPTHDCDSRTAYDAMYYMSDYEASLGLSSHFFLTVHYYRDAGYLSAFYDDESIAKAKLLLEAGHTVGSHSLCHFPDFSTTSRFPLTVVTREEYAATATHDTETNVTTGGSTWAEVVLSKQILEEDLGNKVRSFRTGHLCMNKNIPEAEQEGGYEFSSCYGAGDVLGAFPFLERLQNAWEGEHNGVLVMPLHFSDVISSDPISEDNYTEKPAFWYDIMCKLKGNYSPSILLIHPNREWKMTVEKMLVDMFDLNKIGLFNFEAYGDFWLGRLGVDFEYSYLEEKQKLMIRIAHSDYDANPHLRFVVECSEEQLPQEVVLVDENAQALPLQLTQLAAGRYLASPANSSMGITKVCSDSTPTATPAYNLTGQRVANGYKGVVIQNGKKVLVK